MTIYRGSGGAGYGSTAKTPASDVSIVDAGGLITATDVEGALQENRTNINATVNNLASLVSGQGASLIGINDVGNIITATNVEGALQENRAATNTLISNFANTADVTKGAALVGQSVQVVTSYATLRGIAPSLTRNIRIISGSGGIDGDFYAKTGAAPGTYTDNGGTIIVPTGGDGSAAWLRDYSGDVYAEWFGVIGNGLIDDTIAFNNAAQYCSSNGIVLTAKDNAVIKLSSQVSIAGGFKMRGDFEIRQAATHDDITIAPNPSAEVVVSAISTTTYPVTTGITQTSSITVADGTQFSRGDICMLRSSDFYSGDISAIRKAELIEVNEVSGNTIYTVGKVYETYVTSIVLVKLNSSAVEIEGVRFTYDGNAFSYGLTPTRSAGVTIIGAIRPKIKSVTFYDDLSAGLRLFSCWQPDVDIYAKNLRDNGTLGMYGYGVVAYGACFSGRIRVMADRVRHAYTDGTWVSSLKIRDGRCRDMRITGEAVNCSMASWDTHAGSVNTWFVNPIAIFKNTDTDQPSRNNSFAFQNRSINTKIINPIVKDVPYVIAEGSVLVNHGTVENTLEIIGGVIEQNLDTVNSLTLISLPTQTSPDTVKVKWRDSTIIGYNHTQSAQTNDIIEYRNVRFFLNNIGWSLSNSIGPMRFIGCEFNGYSTMRLGQNNTITMLDCKRFNIGVSNVEPIVVDVGSTAYIDDYYAEATSYGFGQLIRGGLGSNSGTVTLYVGNKITAKNFSSANSIGGNGVATVAIYDMNSPRPIVIADNGDAAKTLQAKKDEITQIWNTPITATRVVTLSTTSAFNGAKFRVVRASGASGAFNIDVGTGPLKSLTAAGQWCDVEYNGSAWVLTGYGTL